MNRINMGIPNLIMLPIELHAIENFFHSAMDSVQNEIKNIFMRHEKGEFQEHWEDLGNAIFVPEYKSEIIVRTVLNETNALVESYLSSIRPLNPSDDPNKIIRWDNLLKSIENEYSIRFESIIGYDDFIKIRKASNAYKHRNGYKNPKYDEIENKYDFEKYQLTKKVAKDAINATNTFLRNLSKELS